MLLHNLNVLFAISFGSSAPFFSSNQINSFLKENYHMQLAVDRLAGQLDSQQLRKMI